MKINFRSLSGILICLVSFIHLTLCKDCSGSPYQAESEPSVQAENPSSSGPQSKIEESDGQDEVGNGSASDEAEKLGKERLKADVRLAGQAMNALKTAPPRAVQIAEKRLESELPIERRLKARLHWIAGSGSCYTGNYENALSHLVEAERLARVVEDAPLLRRSLRFKAAACLELGKYEEGSCAAKEGLEISEQLNDESPYPALLHNEMAGNEARLENYSVAIEHYRKSLEIARRHRNRQMAMMTQHNLADVLSDFGRFDEAATEYEQVLEEAREVENDFLVAAAASSLGSALLQTGRIESASELFNQSLKLSQENEWQDIEAVSLLGIGELEWLAGNDSASAEKIQDALRIFERLGDSVAVLSAKEKLSSLQQRRAEEQIDLLKMLLEEAQELGDRRLLLDLYKKLAKANENAGRYQAAVSNLRDAESLGVIVQRAEDEGALEELRLLAAENDKLKEKIEKQQAEIEKNNYDSVLAQLANQNEIKETKLAASKTLATVLACSAVLLAFVIVVLYFAYQSRSRLASDLQAAGDLLQLQNQRNLELERIAGEEERLESLSVLAAGVAHDFNNLLTAISGSAQFGQLSPERDKKDQMLQQVVEVSDQAAGLTKQLVQFLGGKASQDESSPGLSLQSSQGMLETLCKKAGLTLKISHFSINEMVGLGDLQFQQILVNIVTNAIDASPPKGTIWVALTREHVSQEELKSYDMHQNASEGQYLRLCVADEGKGISRKVKKRMFDPYFSTRRRGRGLGLSSVLGIVHSCNGAIDVNSGSTRGTEFSVLLPIVRSVCVPAQNTTISSSGAVKTTPVINEVPSVKDGKQESSLLLVDDDDLTLQTTANLFAASGIQVITAGGAKQALSILSEGTKEITCVVTDLTMPQFSGKWLAKQIAVRWPLVPVVLYSGCVDDTVDLEDARIASFVQKPFKTEEIIPLIEGLISSSSSSKDSQRAATA